METAEAGHHHGAAGRKRMPMPADWITILPMPSLVLLLLIVLIVWIWLRSLACRDIAVQTARDTCVQQGLQFLDSTVSLQKIEPFYVTIDHFGLKRIYVFDYSGDGLSRHTGCIILQNARVVSIVMEAQ
jgi:hypothetical protein